MNTKVTKRDGTLELIDLDKLHKVVFHATEGINEVSASEVEIKSSLQFYDGITTSEIQETLIKSAADLITEDTPNYQFVAGRLIVYHIRKMVYGSYTPWSLLKILRKNIDEGFYDGDILDQYTEEELNELDNYIKHDRDEEFTYAAMEQFRRKYLVQNRVTKEIKETPQIAYMLIAATLFSKYDPEIRLKWVKDYYDAISTFTISLPTPVMAGVRTPQKQFSSCVLIETADSLDSINATTSAIVKYVSQKAGIGIGAGAIRAQGSPIRNGDAYHTGVVPFIKLFQSATRSCSQGGVRKGCVGSDSYVEICKGVEIEGERYKTFGTAMTHRGLVSVNALVNSLLKKPSERIKLLTEKIKITEARIGNLIRSRNIDTNQDEYNIINQTMAPIVPKDNQLEITLDNGTNIHTSTIHPTLVKRDGKWVYIDAKNLVIGDVCQSLNDTSKITSIENTVIDENFSDFSVDKVENYYAGKDQDKMMVVHNSSTIFFPIFHLEIEDLLVLKNNKGVEDNRVRHMDYGIQFNKLFYERLMENGDITLFSSVDVPELYDAFFSDQDKFRELYVAAENNKNIRKKVMNATELFGMFVEERKNTGRVYLMNVDHANEHSSFKPDLAPIKQSNLCCEITLPTKPLNDLHDEEGEIALCTLSAINWGKIKRPEDFEKPCLLAVRGLDALIDHQDYLMPAAGNSSLKRRSIGIGIINLAYWMAKNDLIYTDPDLVMIDEYAEAWSYYLIKASADLAVEEGSCIKNNETKYSDGILPIDTYKRELNKLVPHKERMPWKDLRKQLKETGIRNSTLMALMPSETSAQISNATNGVEPPRSLVSVKQSKDGSLLQVVPGIRKLKNKYELLWDQKSPIGYLKIMAVLQKYIDQGISVNTSYNIDHYEDEKIPMSLMLQHLTFFYKYGGKQLYYFQTNDKQGEIDVDDVDNNNDDEEECDSCAI